jgi:type II secretion system protein N
MRLPRLRLPAVSLDWLGAFGGRTTVLYLGYTGFLFLVFLVVTFPHEQLVRRALSGVGNGPVGVDFNAVNFAWYKGYEVSGLRVTPPEADDQPPLFEVSRVWVRPSLSALVRGNPYDLLMNAELYGGDAQGEVTFTGGDLATTLQLHGLNLGRYRTLTALLDEGQIAGKVSGQVTVEARGGNVGNAQLSGDLILDNASLTAAKVMGYPYAVPDLHFRQAKLKFALRGGRLEIQDFNAVGDVTLQASGHIVVRDPPSSSVLNLRGTIETSLATPDALKGAVALIPRPPGTKPDAPLNISGTLGAPRLR